MTANRQSTRSGTSADASDACGRTAERGLALILGLMFTIIVVGITVSGSMILKSYQNKTRTNFVTHGQTVRFARSGLTEALGWLRKQTSQPVTSFSPVLDPMASTPILDTIDPEIGIVREFRITGAIWGRYEVWKDWPGDPDSTRLQWRNKMRCVDLSTQRGNLPAGTVWRLRSIGYIYRRVDGTRPYNVQPNQVISQEVLDSEVRRLSLEPPGQSAVCSRRGDAVSVQTKGRIFGGTTAAGVYYPSATGSPTVSGSGASITGAPPTSTAVTYADSVMDVFGVSMAELESMANYVITDPNAFPNPVPINTLVVCKVPITFTAARPLRGTGAVVFQSTVTISPASYSSFSGLLYAAGNMTVREPTEIQGAVVVTGNLLLQGASDFVTLTYDDGMLNRLRQDLGSYRASSAYARPLSQDR